MTVWLSIMIGTLITTGMVEVRRPCGPMAPIFDAWNLTDGDHTDTPRRLSWYGRNTESGPLFRGPIFSDDSMDFTRSARPTRRGDGRDGGWVSVPIGAAFPIGDQGRLQIKQTISEDLFRLTSKMEIPESIAIPHRNRDWRAEEKLQVPVPIPIPVAEQLFVFGQIGGSGPSEDTLRTAVTGRTGLGVKWKAVAGSEWQVRYLAMFDKPDLFAETGARPAWELNGRLPVAGPLELEYTGSAIPAMHSTDRDQVRQELRLNLPIGSDGEFEFGARYRWVDGPADSPWYDRAQLFMGLKLRR